MSSTKTSDKANAAPAAKPGVRLHAKPNAKLIRARKHFEGLLATARLRRHEHANWAAAAARLRDMARTMLGPMSVQYDVYSRQLVLVLHQAHSHPALDAGERATIAEFICRLAEDLLLEEDDSELKQLYNLHSGSDYELDRARHEEDMAEMYEKFYKLQLGEDRDEEVLPGGAADDVLSEVYRQTVVDTLRGKLTDAIGALPLAQQQDWQERLDVAYVNSDVIGCMMLDIELDQLRQPGAGEMARDQLRRHRIVLKNYLRGLELDTADIQFSLIMQLQLQLSGGQKLTERNARESLQLQRDLMEEELEHIACDVVDFQDIAKLKVWVKARQEYERRGKVRH